MVYLEGALSVTPNGFGLGWFDDAVETRDGG